MLIVGAFDADGNATVQIRVRGDGGSKEYSAIIDTGFSGFVAMPQVEMIPLGLTTESAAASVMLGNGDIIYNLVATAMVSIPGREESGSILLDETTNDLLVGMAFLRKFELALILTDSAVILHDRAETLEAVAQFMATAPTGSPNASPSASRSNGESDE